MLSIEKTNKPGEELLKEIRGVEMVCMEYDGLSGRMSFDTSINVDPEINSLFLLYDNGVLASLLSMFMPTGFEAEIPACTLQPL